MPGAQRGWGTLKATRLVRVRDNRAWTWASALPHQHFELRALGRLLCRAQRNLEPRVYGLAPQWAWESAASASLHWQPAIRVVAKLPHRAQQRLEARVNGLTHQRVRGSAALALLNRQRAIRELVKPPHWEQRQLEVRVNGLTRQRARESMWQGCRAVWAILARPPPHRAASSGGATNCTWHGFGHHPRGICPSWHATGIGGHSITNSNMETLKHKC